MTPLLGLFTEALKSGQSFRQDPGGPEPEVKAAARGRISIAARRTGVSGSAEEAPAAGGAELAARGSVPIV